MIWLLMSIALAESWCATPLIVHEWGVTVLLPDGGVAKAPKGPSWLHHDNHGPPQGAAVRTLPADGGERDLPVVHFYTRAVSSEVPLGMEVGFATGIASAWFPAVSQRTDAETANSAAAKQARAKLVAHRGDSDRRGYQGRDLGRDPTKQLHWDRLLLSVEPLTPARPHEVSWVEAARTVEDALWVNGPGESERFLFYEGRTVEASALVVEQGETGKSSHFVLRNRSKHDVHDVVFMRGGKVWTAPKIPAGKTAGFLLETPFAAGEVKGWLNEQWVDESPLSQPNYDDCSMMRDPAVPVEHATGHRMYAAELAVLWTAWEGSLLKGNEQLFYREDPAALDVVMPISVYTDMFHEPQVQRLGVVVVPL